MFLNNELYCKYSKNNYPNDYNHDDDVDNHLADMTGIYLTGIHSLHKP